MNESLERFMMNQMMFYFAMVEIMNVDNLTLLSLSLSSLELLCICVVSFVCRFIIYLANLSLGTLKWDKLLTFSDLMW